MEYEIGAKVEVYVREQGEAGAWWPATVTGRKGRRLIVTLEGGQTEYAAPEDVRPAGR